MADDPTRTDAQLLDDLPPQEFAGRAKGQFGTTPGKWQDTRDRYVKLRGQNLLNGSRMVNDGLAVGNPTTANTIILYRVDYTTGAPMLNGTTKIIAAGTNVVFLGVGKSIEFLQPDGTDQIALSADGKTYAAVMVAILLTTGAISLVVITGAEADDASEVAPTATQIKAALTGAAITNHDNRVYMVVGRFTIRRVAVDTITLVHTSITTDETLVGDRARGVANVVVS